MYQFKLKSKFFPTGDQPEAIRQLIQGTREKKRMQVLLGVTGSGKTFSMANVIAQLKMPTLVISHNKTLAAQLYQEYRDFFPENAVEYFVSYYDYYQPEAYIPQTDTYINKDADINQFIDKLRLSTTTSLMTRDDVIVVASVSCIYNLGSPEEYSRINILLKANQPIERQNLLRQLTKLHYQRNDYDLQRGGFRVKGETIDIWPANSDEILRLEIMNNYLTKLQQLENTSGKVLQQLDSFTVFPAKHYITSEKSHKKAFREIMTDLKKRTAELRKKGKELEAYRLEQRTNYDLELIREVGYCNGIENYSRYFDGREKGSAPYTLIDFFRYKKQPFLVIIDESHMTLPQIRGMYRGDQSRKQTLIDYGFRLPSALDNRPLQFEEFLQKVPQIICTSATPNDWEITQSQKAHWEIYPEHKKFPGYTEQLIRPTGLLEPKIEVRGIKNQIPNLVNEIIQRVEKKERVLVTTLTKKMAEDLSEFLHDQGIKSCYLHADVDTLDRSDILENLRRGKYDVLVGINLLREGLDLPEVSLVAILDADKEGFLRSETSLIQVMGRASRHKEGLVIMYASKVTNSMRQAMNKIEYRRQIQEKYNQEHHITPETIQKPIRQKLINREGLETKEKKRKEKLITEIHDKNLTELEFLMQEAAKNLEFEKAAFLRDKIKDEKEANQKTTN